MRRVVILILALVPMSLLGAPPQSVVERKLDPRLKLLYRAAKERNAPGLAKARGEHGRLHPRPGKGRSQGGAPTREPDLSPLVKFSGAQPEFEATGFAVEAKVGDVSGPLLASRRGGR